MLLNKLKVTLLVLSLFSWTALQYFYLFLGFVSILFRMMCGSMSGSDLSLCVAQRKLFHVWISISSISIYLMTLSYQSRHEFI